MSPQVGVGTLIINLIRVEVSAAVLYNINKFIR